MAGEDSFSRRTRSSWTPSRTTLTPTALPSAHLVYRFGEARGRRRPHQLEQLGHGMTQLRRARDWDGRFPQQQHQDLQHREEGRRQKDRPTIGKIQEDHTGLRQDALVGRAARGAQPETGELRQRGGQRRREVHRGRQKKTATKKTLTIPKKKKNN